MPNGDTIVTTHMTLLPCPELPIASRECGVFPPLQQPLLSLGQFFDAVVMSTLDSETIQITKGIIATLLGTRDHSNSLYFILITGYPASPNSPLITTSQSELSTLTIPECTTLHSYGVINSAYHMNTPPCPSTVPPSGMFYSLR